MNIVIAAGGTAGHINPGIAIAQEIKSRNKDANIVFIGTNYGLEKELVTKAGFEIRLIHSKGLSRNIIKFTKSILSNAIGVNEAYMILKELKPVVCIGMGGYVCGPVLYAAKKMLGIPVYIHESNAIAGKTNKLIGKFADGVAVGFENAKKDFKNKNVVVTGNPVRKEFETVEPLKKGAKKSVLIFGGSQGAKNINAAVVELIKKAEGKLPYNLIYATGKKNYEAIMEQIDGVKLDSSIKIEPYIDDMANVMANANLVVSRSGAITLSELCFIGKPAVLIPLSTAAENHQEFNARVMADKGYAKIILDHECNGDKLKEEIEKMLDKNIDEEEIKKLMPKDATKNFYEMIKEYMK
ncbi:MAG: undecaprenyldiphospho-muramoylpentapeptide beta-N-acetylglucosaminyltransferase [Clostridia bacterium]|nr:undecaprenyldiphospho-muramoylpentapeptide beta-N-acetylglucosaminyltransferase [Clostridia bacterium]